MQSRTFSGVTVVFDSSDQETAALICEAIEKTLGLIQEGWGLRRPEDCRIYVMTSWWKFFFQSATWPWRILLAVTLPLWGFRARRTWPYSAAWTQRFGKRVAIGIKPAWLLDLSDKSIGIQMFVEEKDPKLKIRHLACHELTHACSANLLLPAWLNEGLAAVTVDRYLGKQTIRTDTLELIQNFTPKTRPATYRELSHLSSEAIAYHAVRGYWIVRLLEENRPGFLKRIFSSSQATPAVENDMAVELGIEPDILWGKIDNMIVAHFNFQRKSPEIG